MKIICLIILLAAVSACRCGTGSAGSDNECDYDYNDEEYSSCVYVSEDGLMTIESFAQLNGGSAPIYWATGTIIGQDGEKHEVRFEAESFKSKIHTLHKKDGSTYYVTQCFTKASSIDGYIWLSAYKIVGDTIKMVKVIDGSDKTDDLTEFEVNYFIPDCYFVSNGAGYDWMMEYDKSSGNLYVPLEEDRFITDRYDVWHFNGDRFEHIGQRPHKDLYFELADYNRLIRYFTTKDYIVRVDSLESGGLRYASWRKPKTMADRPDIIIKGGVTVRHPVPSDELQPCDDYRFKSGPYEYIVDYCETKKLEDGCGEHYDYLLVKKDGKVILKQQQELP